MKGRIATAIAIGISVPVLFVLLNRQFPAVLFDLLLLPGYMVFVLLWGPHGGTPLLSYVVLIGVNAVVYGLIAFGILHWARKAD